MPKLWLRHWPGARRARWKVHEPEEGGGGEAKCTAWGLAQGQKAGQAQEKRRWPEQMNPTSRHSPIWAAASVPCPCFDADEFKDLYEPPARKIQFLHVQGLFEGAGYAVGRAELSPHGLPLAYVRMRRRTAPLFTDRRKFRQHIRHILREALPWFSLAEAVAQQDGESVLVSFFWKAPPPAFTEEDLENELLPIPL